MHYGGLVDSNGLKSHSCHLLNRVFLKSRTPTDKPYVYVCAFAILHSGVAQWLACWAHNPKVHGSRPCSATGHLHLHVCFDTLTMHLNIIDSVSYLLGLLAMIKCSICSYQCDNWYVSNWRLACHIIFAWGGSQLGLPSAPQMLPWHGTLLWATHPHG